MAIGHARSQLVLSNFEVNVHHTLPLKKAIPRSLGSYSESVGVRSEHRFCGNNGPRLRGITAFFRGGVISIHNTLNRHLLAASLKMFSHKGFDKTLPVLKHSLST